MALHVYKDVIFLNIWKNNATNIFWFS